VEALLLPEGHHLPARWRDRRRGPRGRSDPEARTELENAVAAQREKLIAKFGHEPGPDDPIFFDLDGDQVRADTADAMRAAGIAPALIYAYEETGLIVTQENRRLIPDVELREFDDKVREYYELIADNAGSCPATGLA
jgi:hypothetical protein